MTKLTKPLALSAALIAGTIALSACSAPSSGSSMPGMDHGSTPMTAAASPSTSSDGSFNDADVMFAQMMVPHHEQAVSMSDSVLSKPGIDARVVDLATRIKAAQQPEIDRLRSWLSAWDRPTAAAGHSMGMDGMMTDDDMSKLGSAQQDTAAKLFLTQMIAHHEGAVAMAKSEAAQGKHAGALAMASSIVESQTGEIDQMKALLASL